MHEVCIENFTLHIVNLVLFVNLKGIASKYNFACIINFAWADILESKMKKMRKYSRANGIKVVPNIPSTFVPNSSPHFVAALSGKGQEHSHRKTSVYRNAATVNSPKKHSSISQYGLPMIQVTKEDVEERSRHVQSTVSSSADSPWTRVDQKFSDTSQREKAASNPTGKQQKTSVKEKVLLGETPHGKDVLFRRKISNTATPKITNAEEKERLLMKYTSLLNDAPMSGHRNKRQRKSMYFSRYNIPTDAGKSANVSPFLSKGTRVNEYTNWTTRSRAQSLNFVPSADIRIKEKATKEVFGSKTFPADSATSDVFSRGRAQTLNLNFVMPRGEMGSAGSAKMRLLKNRTKGLYEITEEMRKQNQRTFTDGSDNLQIEPANNLSASLFLYSQNATIENAIEGKLSPIRDKMKMKLPRQDSQDRNAFLTFPTLRAKSWTGN